MECESALEGWKIRKRIESGAYLGRKVSVAESLVAGRSNTLLFVLFLVLFWAAVARLHCWLSSLKATRCGFPLKNFRYPALAHYFLVLVRPTS